ncbi:hypothetical protein ABT098_03700 [Streptomyces nitrosporeus]
MEKPQANGRELLCRRLRNWQDSRRSGATTSDLGQSRLRMNRYRIVLTEDRHDDLVQYLDRDLLVGLWPTLRTLVSRDVPADVLVRRCPSGAALGVRENERAAPRPASGKPGEVSPAVLRAGAVSAGRRPPGSGPVPGRFSRVTAYASTASRW